VADSLRTFRQDEPFSKDKRILDRITGWTGWLERQKNIRRDNRMDRIAKR
jgi:hypothetical protein